jgi:lysophospholipase L1-like esterase
VNDVAEEKYRGAAVRTLPRPNRQYAGDRVCADVPAMMQRDGIHPAAAAQPLLLENLWPVLKSLL